MMQRSIQRVLRPGSVQLRGARSLSSLPSGPSSSSSSGSAGVPPSSARSQSFLSRHPKKLAALAVTGGAVAYFASSARSSAAVAVPVPPFNLDDYKGFDSLDAFKKQADIVLYQYETCPFCNKVRAFLDYNGISYRTVEVSPLSKKQLRQNPQPELKTQKAVPVLVINGHVLVESTPIIKNVNDIMNLYRPAKQQHVLTQDEIAGLDFVDTRFVRLTAPNLYLTWKDSVASFDYIAQNSQLRSESAVSQFLTRYVGASAMYIITHRKLMKKYNITDPRAELYAACAQWVDSVALHGGQFRGGAQPNLADITAFGVIRALRGYRAFDDIKANAGPKFMAWFDTMDQRVKANAAAPKA